MEENVSLFDADAENEPQVMLDNIQEIEENIEESEVEKTESDKDSESPQSASDVLLGYILHLDEGITTLDKEFSSFCEEEHAEVVTDLNVANAKIHDLNVELKFTRWTLVAFMTIYILKVALGI